MKALLLFPYFLEKRLTIPTSPYFITSKWFFCYLFPYFFVDPLPSFNWWAVSVGGEELKWRQLTHNQVMSPLGPHFCAHSTAKTNDKVQISGRMASICISDVVTASIYSEKTHLNKLMLIMNQSQESMVFGGRQK